MSAINNDIIEGLNKDDFRVMKLFFDSYYFSLCVYAKRFVMDITVAEEIVSDVIYKIWINRKHIYHADTFREYIFIATRNTALNYLKKKQKKINLINHWAERLRYELIDETPLENLITKELQSKLDELVDSLPEQCRKVYLMSRFSDMTYDEIAAEMKISVNTVKYHIKIALQKLKTGLSDSLTYFF